MNSLESRPVIAINLWESTLISQTDLLAYSFIPMIGSHINQNFIFTIYSHCIASLNSQVSWMIMNLTLAGNLPYSTLCLQSQE